MVRADGGVYRAVAIWKEAQLLRNGGVSSSFGKKNSFRKTIDSRGIFGGNRSYVIKEISVELERSSYGKTNDETPDRGYLASHPTGYVGPYASWRNCGEFACGLSNRSMDGSKRIPYVRKKRSMEHGKDVFAVYRHLDCSVLGNGKEKKEWPDVQAIRN